MQTPEGALKKKVRAMLRAMGAYVFSPVQMGMGAATLDELCCVPIIITADMVGKRVGLFVGVEEKAEGKVPTPRQRLTMQEIHRAGGIAIWGDNYEAIVEEVKKALGAE